jgi:hypothetical protein
LSQSGDRSQGQRRAAYEEVRRGHARRLVLVVDQDRPRQTAGRRVLPPDRTGTTTIRTTARRRAVPGGSRARDGRSDTGLVPDVLGVELGGGWTVQGRSARMSVAFAGNLRSRLQLPLAAR